MDASGTSSPPLPTPTPRVALITGGTRGIGRAIAEHFLRRGDRVVVCGRTPPEESIERDGVGAEFQAADVRDPDQVDGLITRIVEDHGRLDIVVNNAGGSPEALAATASPRFHEAIIRLNLTAPLHVAQRANATMQSQESGGSIVNIASVSALRPSPGTAAYGAAKAGLLSLTRSLAVEWAPKVRVNAVVVGMVATEDAVEHYGGPDGLARVAATVPLGRLCTPTDVAEACAWLASAEAGYVSGSSITLDGGGERPAFLAAAAGSGTGGTGGGR